MALKLLQVSDLVTRFNKPDVVHAVNGVLFYLSEGEPLGVVSESGCGKSVTVLSLLRLIPRPPGRIERGEVHFDDRNLLKLSRQALRQVRGGR